jgi:hypothetical protein
MRSNTRGAKIFRAFFGELEREPLCLPKQPRPAWHWFAFGVAAVLLLASLSLLIWGEAVPWMQSSAVQRCVVPAFTIPLAFLILLVPTSQYWPSALTKELIEDLYRPQIIRLREVATHFSRHTEECERRGATCDAGTPWVPLATDLELFSNPSVFSASVSTGVPNEWALVGGAYFGLPAEAPRIVEKSYFRPKNPQTSDAALLAGCVKFSDYSRKNAVVYKGAIIDDGGERREFQLCLSLKSVISQIPSSPQAPSR